MDSLWSFVKEVQLLDGLIGAFFGALAGGLFGWLTSRSANKIARKALETSQRQLQIEEDARHETLTPKIEFKLGDELGSSGYELVLTVTRPIDSGSVALVREFDADADASVMWIVDGVVPKAAGTMTTKAELPALEAGGSRRLSLWLSDIERGAGAVVRLRCEVSHGGRVWQNLVHDVELPLASPNVH
ncbi:hypothetical protein OHB24_17165 [Kribbella sp. NBC_00482]|uniref:hypothetical protein n=1 Tax=Kribbella sp. NBC_00482 TaxID=2975968 RepID=UPI002E18F7D1